MQSPKRTLLASNLARCDYEFDTSAIWAAHSPILVGTEIGTQSLLALAAELVRIEVERPMLFIDKSRRVSLDRETYVRRVYPENISTTRDLRWCEPTAFASLDRGSGNKPPDAIEPTVVRWPPLTVGGTARTGSHDLAKRVNHVNATNRTTVDTRRGDVGASRPIAAADTMAPHA